MKLGASNSSFEVVCVNNEHNVYRMKKNFVFYVCLHLHSEITLFSLRLFKQNVFLQFKEEFYSVD